jgi:hypothetical protein
MFKVKEQRAGVYNSTVQQLGLSPFSPATRSDVRRTKNGLPLRGLLLPSIDMFRVTGKVVDRIAKMFYNIDRAYSRKLESRTMDNPLNNYLEDC